MPPADSNGPRLPLSAYILRIRQHPMRGKVLGKDKDRKPLDPPPVVQLFVRDPNDPAQNYLQSPYFYMAVSLYHEKEDKAIASHPSALAGSITSSLHRLKDMDSAGQSRDGGFFVFGDLSCKVEGKYRLKLVLREQYQDESITLAECTSQIFEVYNTKNFPGMQESTFMSRSFGDQGVRLRIRKESRQLMKRPASSYSPGQTHPSVPGSGFPAQAGYVHPMSNGYAQGYIKSEDGLDEPSAKRQRSSNTSPTNYMERPGAYGSMAQAYSGTQGYADSAYAGVGATSMAMPDNGLMAQSQVNGYGSRGGMGYDGIQPAYPNYDSRQISMYAPRGSDAGSAGGYQATYAPGYQTGSSYPSTSGAAMPTYYAGSSMSQSYPRQPGS